MDYTATSAQKATSHNFNQASYWRYWGKARPSNEHGAQYQLLPYHCLDVAAVGYEYLTQNDKLSNYFLQALKCNKEDWLNWASFWLALHDLGKFSEAFQSQKSDLFTSLQSCEPNPEKQYTERHDSLGQWLWRDTLSAQAVENYWFGRDTQNAMTGLDAWMRAVTGHHGQPPKVAALSGISEDFYSKKDKRAVREFVDQIRSLFLNEHAANIASLQEPRSFEHASLSLSWWFAGVAVLADWLGSDTNYFPYKTEVIPLNEYWLYTHKQAQKALRETGIIPCAIRKDLSFGDIFPKIAFPSPLQEWVKSVEIPTCPQIFLLEDVTGAGKTEAADCVLLATLRGLPRSFTLARNDAVRDCFPTQLCLAVAMT